MVDWGGDDNFSQEVVSARAEVARLRAVLDQMCVQYKVLSKDAEELREEIARLREAVKARDDLLREVKNEVSAHCYDWFEERRAALAPRATLAEEIHVHVHGPFLGAPFK